MLIRVDGNQSILITQPAHASISAQLARAWGNSQFGKVEPFDDVCLGALLHDVGWIDWEQSPTLNTETGLPHTFMQLPTRVHLDIWGPASRRAAVFSRYAGLLTSMHFTGLYERFHDYDRDTPDEARDARALVVRELAFQQDTISALRADPSTAAYATGATLQRNRQLVAAWDALSLALCHGVREIRTIHGVPTADGNVDLTLEPGDARVTIDPWPMGCEGLTVQADARVLAGTYECQDELDRAIAAAAWTTIEMTLRPAG